MTIAAVARAVAPRADVCADSAAWKWCVRTYWSRRSTSRRFATWLVVSQCLASVGRSGAGVMLKRGGMETGPS